jgi:hypothetical protein
MNHVSGCPHHQGFPHDHEHTLTEPVQLSSNWVIVPTLGNGNCLFDSVRKALVSIGYNYTLDRLRACVAKRALDETDEEFNQSLQVWSALANTGDPQMRSETMHVYGISKKPWPWTPAQRTVVMKRMMSPAHYWGDEVAVRSLERALHVRFLVWHEDRQCAMQPTTHQEHFYINDELQSVDIYIVLLLSGEDLGAHYNVLGFRELVHDERTGQRDEKLRYVFRKDTLPDDIKTLFSKYM